MPDLPSEIWLEICRFAEAKDLYLSLRPVNKQIFACAEDVLQSEIIPHFTINLSFSLGTGSHHRWYDVRGSITLSFRSVSKYNKQYALFDKITYQPQACQQRAGERWNQICSAGVGSDNEWRVQMEGGPPRTVRMPNLIISHDHGAWCDWREMLEAYFRPPHLPDRNRMWAWQTV